jgi:type VI secretion system secreted protein VgrG
VTTRISQANRPLLATPPGGAPLVPVSLTGEEAVSQPFLFTVDFTSPSASITAADVLGKPLPLGIPLVDGSTRPVHGIVRRFMNLGRSGPTGEWRYRAEIVPKLWLLTLSSDCRTFEDKSVLDIVEAVCKAAGVTDVRRDVTTQPAAVPYVVQYNETNFDFVSRLLEEAGLYYTFEHARSSTCSCSPTSAPARSRRGACRRCGSSPNRGTGRPSRTA